MSNIVPGRARDINTVATEIRMIQGHVKTVALEGAIEIGRRLCEAKELLPHGEWGQWLKEEFEYSQPTASRLMTLYNEYGADQSSLFGAESKYSTLNNLSISKALRLIAIPAEEREGFAEEHKIEELSTREMDELIKKVTEERDRMQQEALQESELRRVLEQEKAKEHKARIEAEGIAKMKSAAAEKAEKEAASARKAADKALKDMEKAMQEAAAARRDMQELKDNPQVPEEIMAKLREQFRRQAEEAEERARKAEAALKLANPETATFKVQIEGAQAALSSAVKTLQQMKEKDPETAGKLKRAVMAVIDNARMAASGI